MPSTHDTVPVPPEPPVPPEALIAAIKRQPGDRFANYAGDRMIVIRNYAGDVVSVRESELRR